MDEQRCWDIITLDTLHAYCGGSEPTPVARRLNAYSHRRKLHLLLLVLFIRVCLPNVIMSFAEMEAARQRVLVRAKAAHKKGAPKRKADGKDDHPSKKPSVTPREK